MVGTTPRSSSTNDLQIIIVLLIQAASRAASEAAIYSDFVMITRSHIPCHFPSDYLLFRDGDTNRFRFAIISICLEVSISVTVYSDVYLTSIDQNMSLVLFRYLRMLFNCGLLNLLPDYVNTYSSCLRYIQYPDQYIPWHRSNCRSIWSLTHSFNIFVCRRNIDH